MDHRELHVFIFCVLRKLRLERYVIKVLNVYKMYLFLCKKKEVDINNDWYVLTLLQAVWSNFTMFLKDILEHIFTKFYTDTNFVAVEGTPKSQFKFLG